MSRTLRFPLVIAMGAMTASLGLTSSAHAIEKMKAVPAKTMKKAFPKEKGTPALQAASLPRGGYCRAGHNEFRLWWTEEPGNPQASSVGDNNCATVPQEVNVVANQLDLSRNAAVALGMKPVKGDGPRPVRTRNWPTGGDSRYDVAVMGGKGSSGESGLNACRTGLRSNRGTTLRYSTWMRVFTGAAVTEQQQRATTTHEYYHGLQCATMSIYKVKRIGNSYRDSSPPDTVIEASAEWFANAVYPQSQAGESAGPNQFFFGRGTQMCSIPTNLLATDDVQNKYTAATLLLGAFGAGPDGAKAVRAGLIRSRSTEPFVAPRDALVKAYGEAALASGMINAITRSCGHRLAITADIPLVAGTPAPQSSTVQFNLIPGGGPQSSPVTVPPLSTALVVGVGGYPPRDPATGKYTRGVTTSFGLQFTGATGPAVAAAYTSGVVGAASTLFDANGNATLPYADSGIAVVVVANPSATNAVTANVLINAG